ncbi:hypothetical protein C1H46_034781 [Malus baccata]|uniref:Uncharacterized protein n=1 Tax=Malus baccata TaxID=106549 RepID=A0A540KZZ5_MALBA|nr:hypothetical protein C1H46_034781 [Malus baccata]
MEKAEESMLMVEESEEVRVPPSGGNPFLKKAYFLNPTSQNSSIDIPLFKLPPFFSSLPSHFKPKKWPLKVNFRGWLPRESNHWKTWVHQMASEHQSTWKKAGIYEVVFSSTYQIK